MKRSVSPFVLALLLAGCGGSSTPLPFSASAPTATSFTVSGSVLEGASPGSVVRAYRVGSAGVIGGEASDGARAYPVPAPQAVATSGALGGSGEFTLLLPDNGPFLLKTSSEQSVMAVVDDASRGDVQLTTWSTAAARLALAKARTGLDVEQAMAGANDDLAAYFALDDLLRPSSTEDQVDLRLLAEAVTRMAAEQGLDASSLRQALARDLADGRFDGTDAGDPIDVLLAVGVSGQQSGPGTVPLSSTAGSTDLADATSTGSTALQSSLQTSGGAVSDSPTAYVSPYTVNFSFSQESLTGDFQESPRNDISEESDSPPFADWYTVAAYPSGQLPWGPLPASYPAPTIPNGADPVQWQQERVVATGLKYLGYEYQHHHVPDWNPEPYNWPDWISVMVGHNGAGIDCSDFSAWNYNYGLGLQLNTAVATQASLTTVDGVSIQTIGQVTSSSPADYSTLVASLETGDLLYIRGDSTSAPGTGITHVIMWVGEIGQGPDSTPLILDSHDNQPVVEDANGNVIPPGVHLRPFIEGSWYHRAFDHAHRIINENA